MLISGPEVFSLNPEDLEIAQGVAFGLSAGSIANARRRQQKATYNRMHVLCKKVESRDRVELVWWLFRNNIVEKFVDFTSVSERE